MIHSWLKPVAEVNNLLQRIEDSGNYFIETPGYVLKFYKYMRTCKILLIFRKVRVMTN